MGRGKLFDIGDKMIKFIENLFYVYTNEIKFKHIKFIKKYCKERDIDLILKYNDGGGHCRSIKNKHEILVGLADRCYMSVFFHEIAHVQNYENKKFKIYHRYYDLPYVKQISKKYLNAWKRTALLAEQHTDRLGEKLMKQHFPKMDYVSSYFSEYGKKHIRETHTTNFLRYITRLRGRSG